MKIAILILLPTLIFIFYACSTKTILPPEQNFLTHIQDNLPNYTFSKDEPLHSQWARKYLNGQYLLLEQKNKSAACTYFSELSKEELFPLRSVAVINAMESCDYDKKTLLEIWNLLSPTIPRWLKLKYTTTSLALAKKNNMPEQAALFLHEIGLQEPINENKISFFQESLKYAQKAEIDDLIMMVENSLYQIAPRLKPSITKDKLFETARDLENNRNFEKAIIFYQSIIDDDTFSTESKLKAWQRLALCYKFLRNNQKFSEEIGKSNQFLERKLLEIPDDLTLLNIFWEQKLSEVRAVWTQHQSEKAKVLLYELLHRKHINPDYVATAFWILGNIYVEEKKYEQANINFIKALQEDISDQELKEKIIWNFAWNYYIQKKWELSIKHFKNLEKICRYANTKFKAKYFQASAYQQMNKTSKAKSYWRKIAREDPYGYYGIISTIQLNKDFSPITIKESEVKNIIPTMEWLLAMNETSLARDFILVHSELVDDIMDYLIYSHRAYAYDSGIFRFYKMKDNEIKKHIEDAISYIFPSPYKDVIEQHTKDDLIFLTLSIIRQESTFNRFAKSHAHAYGLMQIIPSQAKIISNRHKIPFINHSDIYLPSTNIAIGTKLLKSLLNQFNNNMIFATASYNADIRIVKKWIEERKDLDLFHFIETIPYAETQKYVKLVLRNFIIYKRSNSSQPFKISKENFGIIE